MQRCTSLDTPHWNSLGFQLGDFPLQIKLARAKLIGTLGDKRPPRTHTDVRTTSARSAAGRLNPARRGGLLWALRGVPVGSRHSRPDLFRVRR